MLKSVIFFTLVLSAGGVDASSLFSPIQDSQVPSGMAYDIHLPVARDPLQFQGKRVAILASHGVEESEIVFPVEYLEQRGATVEVLVPEWSKEGIIASQFLKPSLFVKGTKTFAEGIGTDYDLVVLTGGAWNVQVVRNDKAAIDLVKSQVSKNRPLAAICAGTTVLINAGLAQNLVMTGSPAVRIDLENAGAHYIDQATVVAGKILTSRTPNDLPEFVQAFDRLILE